MCQDGGMIWECDQPIVACCMLCHLEVPKEELEKLKGPMSITCVRCTGVGVKVVSLFCDAFLFFFNATKYINLFTGLH